MWDLDRVLLQNYLPLADLGPPQHQPDQFLPLEGRQAIVADYSGTKNFGTLNGLGRVSVTIGALFGPLFVGKALDITGDYTLGWSVTALVVSLSAIAMWAARADNRLITEYQVRPSPEGEPKEGTR